MADSFGLKLGIEGEKEFKKSLAEINQTFKVLGSEMKLVSSQFDKNDNSVQALSARNTVLNKEIDAQKQKIETLRQALANASESFGETDRRTQNWQIQLNNAEASLNGMERELNSNNSALEQAKADIESTEKSLEKVDGQLDDTAESADNMGDEIKDAGDKADKSKERFSKLGSVLKGVGVAMGAVAFILMFIEFPIPMLIPSFVKMDFSDLPALLGAFALGPVYGVIISFMKNLLHIVIKGTSTACVGELCNFMLGAVFSAVAGFVYKRHKSRKTAILGAIAGAAVMAVFSVPSNYFITYPAYVQFYHMPLEAILGMYQAILPSADSLIKCLVIFNMPFTLVKGLLDAVLCMLIYKPLSPILHGRK